MYERMHSSAELSHSLAIEYNRLRNVASVAMECNRLEWNASLRRFVAAACPRPQLNERILSGNSKLYPSDISKPWYRAR